jgi:integrase
MCCATRCSIAMHDRPGCGSLERRGWNRRVPLEPARLALKRWQEHSQRKEGLVFPSPQGGMYAKGHDWNWRGGYYRVAKGKLKQWNGVLERSGIKRRVRWHDLRHTCAANLVSGSWDRAWRLEEVRAFLGHSSITTTEIYAHLAPDALHATARQTALQPQQQPRSRTRQPVMNLSRRRGLSRRNVPKLLVRPEGFEFVPSTSPKPAARRGLA